MIMNKWLLTVVAFLFLAIIFYTFNSFNDLKNREDLYQKAKLEILNNISHKIDTVMDKMNVTIKIKDNDSNESFMATGKISSLDNSTLEILK